MPTAQNTPEKAASRLRRGPRALGLVLVVALLGSACASYPMRTQEAWRDFQRGQFEAAQAAFADKELTRSEFLSGAEAGTVALAAGDWDAALLHLGRAANESREFEDRSFLAPDKAAEDLASWILNDTSQKYIGEGFERVYLHAGLALAYLALGRLDDVFVENKLANQLLEREEELYEKQYGAGGLGHFLSALAYELLGEPDQAYIDYQRMEAKGLAPELVGPALVRLATSLNYGPELPALVERFGPAPELVGDEANIVVVAGIGSGPVKVEHSLNVPTADGLFRMVVPAYEARPQPVHGVRLVVPSAGASVRTVLIEDVSRVAEENLEDRLAWTTTKSVGRGILKRSLTRNLEGDHGLGGRIIGDLFTLATERADLRCWQTLPASWQAARVFVAPGVHEVVLEGLGGERVDLGRFQLEPGETMIVVARTVGRGIYAHPLGGLRVGAKGDRTEPTSGEAPLEP